MSKTVPPVLSTMQSYAPVTSGARAPSVRFVKELRRGSKKVATEREVEFD